MENCAEGRDKSPAFWATALLSIACLPLHAQEAQQGLNYSIGLSLEHSDNINESSVAPVSQTVLAPQLNFDWTEQGSVLQANASGQIEYRDYLGGAFDNEFRGQLAGVANWIIFPQRLNFDFEEYAGVAPVNIFATNAPGNQQQTNVFTLGPTLQFRLGNELSGAADLRFTNTTASVDKDFNSDRALGAVRLARQLNSTDQLSGNVEVQKVHFTDDPAGIDYASYSGYARYLSKLSQIDLDLALGYSKLNFSGFPGTGGVLARGKVDWRATASSTFEINASREYSDASQSIVVDPTSLLAGMPNGQINVGSVPINSSVYLDRNVSVAYTYQLARFTLRLAPHYEKLNYLSFENNAQFGDVGLDQTAHGALLDANYLLSPLWSVGFFAWEETRKYTQIDRRDEDLHYGINVTNQMSRHWSLRFDLLRNQRASTAFAQGYGENAAMLTLIFKR